MVGELRASHLVHLHRLLREIAAHCEDHHGMATDQLDGYRAVGVLATDFTATKPQHEAALMELSTAVADWASTNLKSEDPDDTEEAGDTADSEPEPTPSIGA